MEVKKNDRNIMEYSRVYDTYICNNTYDFNSYISNSSNNKLLVVMIMNKEEAIRFAGLMEEYLHIPSFVCEMIQDQLENNNYKEVVEYVIQRRNEIESKKDYISEQQAINMWINKLKEKDKQIDQLTNNWNELEEFLVNYRTNIDNPDIYEEGIIDCLDDILDKMKEIKERNNEVNK